MLKLSAVSVAFFAIAASGASACVVYETLTDTFTNTCETEQYIEFRTVGGGCYTEEAVSFSLKPNEAQSFPKLSEPCGAAEKWNAVFGWCDQAEFDAGTCKPKY